MYTNVYIYIYICTHMHIKPARPSSGIPLFSSSMIFALSPMRTEHTFMCACVLFAPPLPR